MRTHLTTRLAATFALGAALSAARPAAGAGEFVWPVTGQLTATTVYPGGADHQGASADIAAPMWTPIGASRFGSSGAYWEGGGCGNYAWITHASGYITLYCHMVQRPTSGSVGTNQTIGYIGVTGNTTGPHVHWAIRQWGVRKYIPGSYIGMRVSRGSYVAGNYGLSGTSGSSTTTTTTTTTSSADTNHVWYQVRVTSGDGINVRSGPGTGYSRVGGLNYNQVVNAHGASNGWYKIWFGGGWRWIISTYTARTVPSYRITSGDGVNVRTGPGTGYARVGGLYVNNIVAVFGTSGSWLKICHYDNGGWQWRWIMNYAVRV